MLRNVTMRFVCLGLLTQCFIASLDSKAPAEVQIVPSGGSPTSLKPDALLRNAIELAASDRPTEADAAYKAALAAAQDLQGSEGLLVADVLFWQAGFLRDRLRQYDDAWNAAERALRIREPKLGESDPRTARTQGLLGSIALWQGLPDKAEPHFRAVVDAYNHHPSKEFDIVAASAAKQLAVRLRDQSRFSEAETLMKRGIEIREQASQRDEPALAFDFETLGLIYNDESRFADAEGATRRSLEITQRVFGPEHVRVSNPLTVLGLVFQSAGRYGDAENAFKQALALREKIAPNNVFTLDTLLIHLGTNYRLQNRYSEAEPLLRRALAIREATFKPDDPQIADSLFNLGALYRAQRRYSEAEPLFRRSLAIREAAWGPENRHVLS